VIRGTLTSATASEYGRDKGIDYDFEAAEVYKYELTLNGKEKHYFNWSLGVAGARVNGLPLFPDEARIMGLI
jgi:hypothetical protein